MADAENSSSQLERELGYWDIVFLGVGSILGAGIYAIVGEATALAGNMLWLSLGLAAVTAFLVAGCYAELVSMYPDSGGGYEFLAQGFSRTFANVMSIIILLTGIVSPAAISLAFGDYFARLWDIPVFWTSTSVIVVMAGVTIVGAKESSKVNMIATLITVAGLLLVIGLGIPHWGEVNLLEIPEQGWAGIFSGAALAFFSYVGFEDVVKMAEETKEPKKNIPWGLLTSSLVVMVVYLVVAISAVSAVEWQELAASDGPLAAVMQSTWGATGVTVISVVALFATSKCIMTNIQGTARLVYDLSRDSALPRSFGKLVSGFQTPVYAIIGIAFVVWLFSLIGDLGVVASISNLMVMTLFLMVCVALVRIRLTHEGDPPAFRLPLNWGKVSLINIAAIVMLAVMYGFNIYYLVQTGLSG